MRDLSPSARELLALGGGAGEPDDAAVARTRASLMMRVGGGAVAVAAVGTVAAVAHAAPLPVVAAASASIAPAAPAVSAAVSLPLIATPMLVKIAAAVVLVASVSGIAYRVQSQAKPASAKVAQSVEPTAARAASAPSVAELQRAIDRSVPPPPSAEEMVAMTPPPAAAPAPERVAVQPTRAPSESAPLPSPPSPAPSSLAQDVASLREAQAALVAGNPRGALEAAERVQASGPLAEEREGVQILAACALGEAGAVEHARGFAQRHPEAPVALRVRAACLGEK